MQRTRVPKSVHPVSSRWMPELWASPKPFGLGEQHSNNFWEVWSAARHNTLRSVKDSRKSEKVRCFGVRWRAGTYQVKGNRAVGLVS